MDKKQTQDIFAALARIEANQHATNEKLEAHIVSNRKHHDTHYETRDEVRSIKAQVAGGKFVAGLVAAVVSGIAALLKG